MARRSRTVLTVIGVSKLIKTTTLTIVGIFALHLMDRDAPAVLRGWGDALGVDALRRLIEHVIHKGAPLSEGRLAFAGAFCLAYAAVFAIEGIGLLLAKRWAEWLTVIITTSFLPFEIYELVREVTAMRVVVLILNVAIVIYLAIRLWQDRHEKQEKKTDRRSGSLSPSVA